MDPALQQEVEQFRSETPENEIYFLETQKLWELSSKAARLADVDEKKAADELRDYLKSSRPKRNLKLVWFRNIAAAVLVLAMGYWIYQQNTKIVYLTKLTGNSQVDTVKLADGSVIVMAENSELKYPEKFDGEREISFSKGQAFFKVAQDPAHPFKVVMNKSDVTVLGTSFNIKVSSVQIDLSVKTGRVMFSPFQNGSKSILSEGQAITYDSEKGEIVAKTAQNADAWLTKELTFVDTPLEEVCKQLSAYYNADIKLQNNRRNKKLNATFKNQTLAQVLEVLNETYNIKIKKEKDQIILITP
ncbi:FecR domain-containing protein [Pedobacter sp. KR3-3]|uniref:FecR domain-containing protein n=1 Tax=Pedobacter albus TaxID=3113905 RepID=A0ABU7I9L0_9SPHI|nr:FecR domain-containing protein [Pedobacter sp. KR3-3]MEE1946041.1 FecR domain-containing protein [Pedobacter sp. KR3-3]